MKIVTPVIMAAIVVLSVGAVGTVGTETLTTDSSPTEITECTVIESSGTYVLTSNITNSTLEDRDRFGSNCIAIRASDVVLDGAGHAVDGNYGNFSSSDPAGIGVNGDNVTIRNIVVSDWTTGIEQNRANNLTVTNVTVTRTGRGITLSHRSRDNVIRNSYIHNTYRGAVGPSGIGIYTAGSGTTNSTIVNNTVENNTEAIYLQGTNNTIADNQLRNHPTSDTFSWKAAMIIAGDQNTVTGNDIRDGDVALASLIVDGNNRFVGNVVSNGTVRLGIGVNTPTEYAFNNSTVAKNQMTNASIVLADGSQSTIADNTVVNGSIEFKIVQSSTEDPSGPILEGHSNMMVSNNTVSDAEDGIVVRNAANTTLDGNDLSNVERGIRLDTGGNTTVINNAITESEKGIIANGNVSISENRVANSTTAIQVLSSSKASIVQNTIERNHDGIRIVQSAGPVVIESNRILDNDNGVHIGGSKVCGYPGEGAEAVAIHDNDIVGNSAYGVLNEDNEVVNATQNFWGASSGPSSANDSDAPFADPVTEALADGEGDAVSENSEESGISNVHFDPWLNQSVTNASVDGAS